MKKSLLALAVLGVFAGAASAQSSVTLFGVVDVNAKYVKNDNAKSRQLGTNGLASSRLGFRGVEDLGGGLQAGFWIEGAISPDTGAGAQTWQRRSTVSLMGGWGEVRLGRDYTPTFWNLTVFDPFGTNGVGAYTNLFENTSAGFAVNSVMTSGATTLVRASNTVGYLLPQGIGGVYGQAMIAAPEGNAGSKYEGGRIGWGAGPINVAAAYGQTRLGSTGASPVEKFKMFDFGGSYDIGFAQFMAQYARMTSDRIGVSAVSSGFASEGKQTNWLVGVLVPMGQGQIRASYASAKGTESLDGLKAKQYAIGYVYNLSKRTALYGTYAHIKNDNLSAFTVGAPPNASQISVDAAGTVTPSSMSGKSSSGAELGIRHSF